MYRQLRTCRVRVSQNQEALPWAKAGAELLNRKYPGHNLEAEVEAFGTATVLHWTYAKLAEAEQWAAQLSTDEEYSA